MSAATAEAPETPGEAPEAVAGKAARPKPRAAVIGLLALAVAAGGGWWFAHRGFETTDDAQIDADVVPVPSRTSGAIVAVHFSDNQVVKAGDLLVELDPAPAKARLAQAEAELVAATAAADAADATATLAEANAKGQKAIAAASLTGASVAVVATSDQIAEAKANLVATKAARDKAKLELERTKTLVQSGAVPGAQLESAQAAYDTAEAQVTQAEARVTTIKANTSQAQAKVVEASAKLGQVDTVDAQIAEAKAKAAATRARVATASAARDLSALELSYTSIRAPRAGIASKRTVALGQMVGAGQTIVSLVPTDAIWITANFKETQLAHMHVGQPVTFSVDAYGGRELHGSIESFSGATGAKFALLPPDNATGNFTKVVQRVPVRVKITESVADLVLRPGMSVELSVDTRK